MLSLRGRAASGITLVEWGRAIGGTAHPLEPQHLAHTTAMSNGHTRPNVLVIGAQPRDHHALAAVDGYQFHFLDLDYSARFNRFNVNLLAYLDEARRYIEAHDIAGLYYSFDLSSLLAAVLCAEYGLPGPSLAATFTAYYKLYTRLFTGSVPQPRVCRLGDALTDWPPYPFYIKAPCSAAGVLGFTIRSDADLAQAMHIVERELPAMNAPLFPFYRRHLDLEAFPLALEHVFLVEDCVSAKQMTLEGFVRQGEVHFTAATDTNRFPNSPLIDNFSLPSRIPEHTLARIRAQAQRDIAQIGLDNSFFNVEYWYGDDEIKLIEINARAATTFYNLYRRVLGYDVYQAGVELCLGQRPAVRCTAEGVGGQFNVITTQEGNSSDLFDYDVHIPFFTDLFIKSGTPIRQLSEYGIVIAQIELLGDTFAEIGATANAYRRRLLKRDAVGAS